MRLATLTHAAPRTLFPLLWALTLSQAPSASAAGPGDDSAALATTAPAAYSIHGQATYTEQETTGFEAPYRGPNSLSPNQGRETTDATLYLGYRLSAHTEAWINPEIDQGFGLDDTLGLAGFSSGEAYKVGRTRPYFRLQRAFIRHTEDLGGALEETPEGLNQFALTRTRNRLVLTVGKMSVGDIFDANQYAHDPRGDFLNWTIIDSGAFDYAADAWGYTVGAAAEWYTGDWTARGGFFDLSNVPNSEHLQSGFHQFQWIAEAEHRHVVAQLPGKVLLTTYQSYGHMALLSDAIAYAGQSGGVPSPEPVRQYRSRTGASINIEQSLTAQLGAFARLGRASGNVEAFEFTDVDSSILGGLSLKGMDWKRPGDTVGLAYVENRISAVRRDYLNDGGLGILVGDGRLPHAGPEEIAEAYYSLALVTGITVTLDYQRVQNPAYNRDRGPVSIFAFRLHAQF